MIIRKIDKSLTKNTNVQHKNADKIWCPERGHYRYIEVCQASCKKINRCEAYADYREPKLI